MRTLIKQLIKNFLARLGYTYTLFTLPVAAPALDGDVIAIYDRQGRVPWSPIYDRVRGEAVRQLLISPARMGPFRSGAALPPGYGVGIDERCVEYPWVLARIQANDLHLMDAGSALNHPYVLASLMQPGRSLHVVTLAPESYRMVDARLSYFYCDLRDLFFVREAAYDVVARVSTLEHVGMDNQAFTRHAGSSEVSTTRGEVAALEEMWRIVKPGGRLLITLPFGRRGDFGTFRQYDQDTLKTLLDSVPNAQVDLTYFRYRKEGWNRARAEECADADYMPWCMLPAATRGSQPPREPDLAAAARAVACIELIKNSPNPGC